MFRFRRKSESRRRFLPFIILRLLLSLAMFLVLGLLAYQAFLYFSGQEKDSDIGKTLLRLKENPKETAGTLSQILGLKWLENISFPNVVSQPSVKTPEERKSTQPALLKFALVTDSHNDNQNLAKALEQAEEKGAKFIIGLGDWTATGTTSELEEVKKIFEASSLPYYLTAGDHDLWDCRDKKLPALSCFNQVFGSAYQVFGDTNIRFVTIYNSDNYEGLDDLQMTWLKEALTSSPDSPKATFVFLHEPLFHPTSDQVMGKLNKDLTNQAQELINLFKESGVAGIFAGHTHAYSRYEEPKSGLKMITIGAVTAERNVQKPRFALVDVFEDGSYNVEDLELK